MTLTSELAGRAMGLPAPMTRDLVVERDLRVPMPDGVELLADRYAPRPEFPQPTVLVRSPYGRAGPVGLGFGRLLAERGLQVVIQSVRGTFGSGGRFEPFDERADGLATLEWLRAQPWHEGGIGMTGPSYLGIVQWALAREAGDSLTAMAPSVTASRVYDQAYAGGSIALESALSWAVMVAAQERRGAPLWMLHGLRGLAELFGELPLEGLYDRAASQTMPFFADWVTHVADEDPYWRTRDYSEGVGDVTAPVQLVGGWQDIFLPWMLADFEALQAAGRNPQLVIGPWAHTSPELARVSAREGLAWLRKHLLGDDRMASTVPVRIWMGGERRWRHLDEWPPDEARGWRLHARAGGGLTPGETDPDEEPGRYRYDPADPTPSLGGPVLLTRNPVTDNRPLEARADVLVFTTDPLTSAVDAIGPVPATVHARASSDHFDLFVRVCDVLPTGASLNVCDALVRVEPGRFERGADGAWEVPIDLWPTARHFAAGHRIRMLVASGAHPRYARNLGTGEDPLRGTDMAAVDVEILSGTSVELPVIGEPSR